MKAIQMLNYGEIEEQVSLTEVNKPKIESNEVLVEVYAAGVNPIDLKILSGALKQITTLEFPALMGEDLSGKVSEIGSEVKDFEVGDEVYASAPIAHMGAFAEYISIDASLLSLKPKTIGFEETAGLPLVAITTLQALKKANLKKDDRILIHAGSGGIGSFAIQYAKAIGAVVYTTASTKNVDWVKKLGVERVIDYRKENYLDIVKDFDVVFDTLGHSYTRNSFKVLKKGGVVVTLNGPVDKIVAKQLGLNAFFRFILFLLRIPILLAAKRKEARYISIFTTKDSRRQELKEIADLVDDKLIRPIVDRIFPLSKAIDALQYQRAGRTRGKIILQIKE